MPEAWIGSFSTPTSYSLLRTAMEPESRDSGNSPRQLCSDYTIEEARRNLSEDAQRARLERLLKKVETTSATTLDKSLRSNVDLREKDWPVLGGAVAVQASHLITGDLRDFGRYFGQTLLGMLVQPPGDYLRSRS